MPRIAPTLYEFVELDNGDYLKVTEACLRIFDRQDWLRVNRARARIKVLVDKIGIDAFREMVERGARGRLGRRARLLRSSACCWTLDEEDRARPRPPRRTARPNGDRSEFERVPRGERRTRSARRASRRCTVKVTRGDLSPEQFRGLGRDHARVHAAATRGRPCSRTSSCAGSATSRSTTSGSDSASSGSATPARRQITDVVSCPGTDSCKLGITSSMGLNRARPGADRVDGDHRSADPADPHQDARLPERLRPAPHRRRSASTAPRSRSASTRSPPTSRTSAATTRTARSSSASGSRSACPRSACPTRSSAGSASTRPSATRARPSTTSPTGSAPAGSRSEVKDLAMPVEFNLENMHPVHRLEPPRSLQGRARRGRVRDLSAWDAPPAARVRVPTPSQRRATR